MSKVTKLQVLAVALVSLVLCLFCVSSIGSWVAVGAGLFGTLTGVAFTVFITEELTDE